ncbi:hypothetical protein ACFLU6_06190 [Acidobacteriota bacterium]
MIKTSWRLEGSSVFLFVVVSVIAVLVFITTAFANPHFTNERIPFQMIDTRSSLEFIDIGVVDGQELSLQAGKETTLELSFPFTFKGKSYRCLSVSPQGTLMLLADPRSLDLFDGGERSTPKAISLDCDSAVWPKPEGSSSYREGPVLEVFHAPLVPGPDSRLIYQDRGNLVSVRWINMELQASGHEASFECLLMRDGAIRFQYYVVPTALPASFGESRLSVGIKDAAGSEYTSLLHGAAPSAGIRPTNGYAVEFIPAGGSTEAFADCTSCPPSETTWCSQVAKECNTLAERGRISPNGPITYCDINVNDAWIFDEEAFCRGCDYTFYILVECGTEMHFPFDDMEGATITVTEVLTGQPVPITCENSRYKDPNFSFSTCPLTGMEVSGPPFQATGESVSWGFPYCDIYDQWQCNDADANGVLDISPGERQTMDCWTDNPQGLCGIYRVDITSGGYYWKLFSNCDGTSNPGFEVFDSCADACAAYNPNPELVVDGLAVTGTCPDYTVEFDIKNIGCTEASSSHYSLVSSCPEDPIITSDLGLISGNGQMHVTLPYSTACTGMSTLTVYPDPDDALIECSENANAAACNSIPGAEYLSLDICDCNASVVPATAGTVAACDGDSMILDGSLSTIAGCGGVAEYRWMDPSGTAPDGWSTSPFSEVTPSTGIHFYTLEMRCSSEPFCIVGESLLVDIGEIPTAHAGEEIEVCRGESATIGSPEPGSGGTRPFTYSWSPADTLSDPTAPEPEAAPDVDTVYTLTVTDALGCTAEDTIQVTVLPNDPPVDVGNSLKLVKDYLDVNLSWASTGTFGYEVRMAYEKDFSDSLILHTDVSSESASHRGGVLFLTGDRLAFYRIATLGCH